LNKSQHIKQDDDGFPFRSYHLKLYWKANEEYIEIESINDKDRIVIKK